MNLTELVPIFRFQFIISHNWDIDTYCQDPEWKEVMVQWRDLHLHASVREVDEHGLDEENSPFLMLALKEAMQAVKDGLGEETLPVEERQSGAGAPFDVTGDRES